MCVCIMKQVTYLFIYLFIMYTVHEVQEQKNNVSSTAEVLSKLNMQPKAR